MNHNYELWLFSALIGRLWHVGTTTIWNRSGIQSTYQQVALTSFDCQAQYCIVKHCVHWKSSQSNCTCITINIHTCPRLCCQMHSEGRAYSVGDFICLNAGLLHLLGKVCWQWWTSGAALYPFLPHGVRGQMAENKCVVSPLQVRGGRKCWRSSIWHKFHPPSRGWEQGGDWFHRRSVW